MTLWTVLISTDKWSLKNGIMTLVVGSSFKYFFFWHLKRFRTIENVLKLKSSPTNSQWVSNVGDRSIHRDDVTGDCKVSVDTIQLLVPSNVFGLCKLESFATFARTASILLHVYMRPIVPVDLGHQHVVLLLKKWIRRFDVVKIIFRNQRQRNRSRCNILSLSLINDARRAAWRCGMFVQLSDHEKSAYCHENEVDEELKERASSLTLRKSIKIRC